jgi:hypothetical protein
MVEVDVIKGRSHKLSTPTLNHVNLNHLMRSFDSNSMALERRQFLKFAHALNAENVLKWNERLRNFGPKVHNLSKKI